ncbi:ABC transporter substrate binding protein [Crenothrix polyspora]|uniref:Extracellular ligand-binding receptor n=1 Tax=Crenothrix polyspora TaxID=360316 RepID=A0A1R4HAF2_9GAMM|nr:ABC transporter substrate binding protein [Crenothrix polyspora]SJM93225.1 Extracellular ligand-binding receptor [Crenothrix polyspora]
MKAGYLWLLLLVCLSGCSSPDFELMAKKRLEYARQNKGDIEIVVFEDPANSIYINGTSTYLNGIKLAVENINQRSGKLLGRSIKLNIEQDASTFDATKNTLRRIADNPKITAVLGHADSNIAIPASVVYERSQILFMPPFSTAQGLTSHNFQYVFRMMPSAKIMAEQLVSVANILGYQKIVILYSRDDVNRELAFLFEDFAVQMGIDLVQNSSFFAKETNYRPLISQFNSKAFDAIFIAAGPEASGHIVQQLREMGINKPLLGNEVLNVPSYTETAGAAAENTIVPIVFRPTKNNSLNMNFIKQYQQKYAVAADIDAAQGYDSIMLLATAIEKAGSTIPPLLSSTLHYLPAWPGVTGLHAFDSSGELRGKRYLFNVWQGGAWHVLPAINSPYLLRRFEKSLLKAEPNKYKAAPFSKLMAQRLSADELKITLLELAQAILKFTRIGIIYENTESGRQISGYNILKQMVDKHGLKLLECVIPFSTLDRKAIERELVNCFGKLSLSTDTQYVSAYEGIDENLVHRLNRILPLFKSSSLSVEGRQADTNLSLVLDKRSDVDPLGLGSMQVYRSLLHGMNVQQLGERLQNFPEIAINLKELQKLGVSDETLLLLSPSSYMGLGTTPDANAAQ